MDPIGSYGLIRRALPFFATFVVGIMIASFFVDINRPRARVQCGQKFREIHRLRMENEHLRNDNLRLRNQLEARDWNVGHQDNSGADEFQVPALDLPPMPPPPPSISGGRNSGR